MATLYGASLKGNNIFVSSILISSPTTEPEFIESEAYSRWLLLSGFWDDNGYWDDTATWVG